MDENLHPSITICDAVVSGQFDWGTCLFVVNAGLQKAKEYDWKDSNMALFGSDVEKNIKSKLSNTSSRTLDCDLQIAFLRSAFYAVLFGRRFSKDMGLYIFGPGCFPSKSTSLKD